MKSDNKVIQLFPGTPEKPAPKPEVRHVRFAMEGDNVRIHHYLRSWYPNRQDKEIMLDGERALAFLYAQKQKGQPVTVCNDKGELVDMIDYLGLF